MAIKNQSITVCYVAWDTAANAGKTGDVANHTLKVITDGTAATPSNSATEVDATNAPGIYKITLTTGEMNGNTVALAGKSSTSGIAIIPVFVATERGNLDAAVTSRMATFTYTAPDSAATIATAVWAAGTRTLSSFGTLAADVWAVATRALTDKAGFSLSTAPPTAAEIRADLDASSTKLANLDAAVTSRMATFTYTTPPTVAAIRADLDANSTKLANLDATVSSRLADADYDTPPTATENADALLKRDWTSVSGEAARSALNALRTLRNKVTRSGATLTITKEDDSTSAFTATLTTDADAEPIIGVDPA